jgi:hypothetical protein
MTIIASTTNPVHRHQQDTGWSCGRACAQMIISSLKQAGSAANAVIAVEQEMLRTRETNKIDIAFWWYTEPDELHGLLSGAPELVVADRDWRVASHSTADKLLADLILSMQAHGRPAAASTGPTEHWMVLAEVHEESGQYVFVFLNPLPSLLTMTNGAGFQHLYMDSCLEEDPCFVANRGNLIADLNLKIKGFTRPETIQVVSPAGEVQPGVQLPPASTVDNYIGKAVGVAFGPPPPAAAVTQLAQTLKASRLAQHRIMAIDPVDTVRDAWRARFQSLAVSFNLTPVNTTLTATDLTLTAIRLVEDVLQTNHRYVLCTGYSNQARSGFIAAFDSSTEGELLHVQITTNKRLITSLARYPADHLYWTNEPTSHFPPMAMPYFVFRRKPGQPDTLVRLYDDAEGRVVAGAHRGPGPE